MIMLGSAPSYSIVEKPLLRKHDLVHPYACVCTQAQTDPIANGTTLANLQSKGTFRTGKHTYIDVYTLGTTTTES